MKKLLVVSIVSFLFAHSAWAAPTITVNLTAGANATSHRIERQVGAGAYATLTTITMPTVTYTDSTVATGSAYCYRAVAISSLGESAASAPCCSSLFAPGVPSISCTVNP